MLCAKYNVNIQDECPIFLNHRFFGLELYVCITMLPPPLHNLLQYLQ
jgi:hypothetical protein